MRYFNQILLMVLGLGLVAAGVLGVLVTTDVLSAGDVNAGTGYQEVFDWWRGRDWARDGSLVILIVAGVVVALLALVLIALELRPRSPARARRMPLGDRVRGRTQLRLSSLINAVEKDVGNISGVDSVAVKRLRAEQKPPEVELSLVIGPEADARTAGRAAVQRAASGVAQALGASSANVTTTVKASRPRGGTSNGRVE